MGKISTLGENTSQLFYTHLKKGYSMPPLPLPLSFTEKGFVYQQVEREGDLAIYSQTHPGGAVRYEVVRIRIQRAHTWPTGVTTPEKEAYPGSNSWGHAGLDLFLDGRCQSEAARPPGPARRGDRRPRAAGACAAS